MFLRIKGLYEPSSLLLGDNINRSLALGIGDEHDLSLGVESPVLSAHN